MNIVYKLLGGIAGVLSACVVYAHNGAPATKPLPTDNTLYFIENKGQWDAQARFSTGIGEGGTIFLTNTGMVYNYASTEDLERAAHAYCGDQGAVDLDRLTIRHHAYKVEFKGSNPSSSVVSRGGERSSRYNNYFIGPDRSRWASNVGLYRSATFENIYPGIDVTYYSSSDNNFKYDFIVKAGSAASRIALTFKGDVEPAINERGDLTIRTSVNTVTEKAPYSYQVIDGRKVEVATTYVLRNGELSFGFPNGYNTSYDLIIDPELVFVTYSGSTAGSGSGMYSGTTTYDQAGNCYVGAKCYNTGWPVSLGSFQQNFLSSTDCGINKYNALGTSIIYSTYYASSGADVPLTLRVNAMDELVIGGMTTGSVPMGNNPFQGTNTGQDLFVAHLSADGTTLLGATFLGDAAQEFGSMNWPGGSIVARSEGYETSCAFELNFDAADNIYVVTTTTSTSWPTTSNAAQLQNGGGWDGVVMKFTPDLSNVLFSTYLGGSGDDVINSIDVLGNGNIVLGGVTRSTNFPTTTGTYMPASPGGTSSGYVTVLDPATGAIVASTYVGTANNTEHITHVQVDRDQNIVVLGRTNAANGIYPATAGTYSNAGVGGTNKLFVQKFNAGLTTSMTCAVLNSASTFFPSAFVVDMCGNSYVCTIVPGQTMPLTVDAHQTTPDDFWMGALNRDMSELIFGSYVGDGVNGNDHCHTGVNRLDPQGIVYHSICAASGNNWQLTPNAVGQKNRNMGQDILTFKFNFDKTGVQASIDPDRNLNPIDSGCAPHTVVFQNNSQQARSFFWDFGDGATSTQATPTHTYMQAGDYNIMLVAINDSTCITHDTAYLLVRVYDVAVPQLRVVDTNLCVAVDSILITVDVLNPSSGVPGNVFSWQAGGGGAIHGDNNTQSIWIRPAGTFTVTVLDSVAGVCTRSATATVNVNMTPRILEILTPDTAVCVGDIVPIRARGSDGYTYRWQPTIGLNDSTLLEPQITVNRSQLYMVTASYPYCIDTSDMINITMHEYPVVEVMAPSEACEGSEVRLRSDVSPYRNDYIYTWSNTGSAILPATNVPNVSFLADTVDRMYYLKVETPIGCSDSVSKFIVFHAKGNGDAISGAEYCAPGSAQLWAMNGASYQWDPAYGLDDPTSATPVTNVSTNTNYKVYITDDNNCVDTLEVAVQVHPRAVLSLPKEITVYPGEGYQAAPETNALYFEWFPPSGLSNPDISDPYILPAVRTRYVVTARTENGCEVTDSMDVLVGDPEIGMPNAYNPSNPEARLFKPVVRGGWDLKSFRIYNRWGTLIYESSDIKSGWDGTFNSTAQPFGVYVWIIEAVNANGETYQQTGNVTMIR